MSRRCIFTSLALLAFVAGAVFSVLELRPASQYSVIVLTVESTRMEAFSPELTPHLWRAAQEGTRFTQHRTSSAWTGANIVSILTGLSAFRHGIHSRETSVPADWDLPLKRLSAAGWRIEGIQPFMLIDGFRNLGLDISPGATPTAWLATRASTGEPFLLWYHYLDTHLPYEPTVNVPKPADAAAAARMAIVQGKPAIPHNSVSFLPSDKRWIDPLYHAQFRVFDGWFREFWQFFDNSGLRETTILVLTTDHGEELLERGTVGHASTTRAGHLHDEISRIPLIVWLPPSLQPENLPRTITAPSNHLDIMPTILHRLLPEDSHEFEGRDLFTLPDERPWNGVTSKAGFAESNPGHIDEFIAARVENRWKLHVQFSPPAEVTHLSLYDLQYDPGETNDISALDPDRTRRMLESLMPDIVALRIAAPTRTQAIGKLPTAPPEWVFPKSSTTVTFSDLPSPLTLRWDGVENADYRLQYRAGEGVFSLKGEIAVTGLQHDFGPLSRDYWNRYIVPYGVFQLRLGPAGLDNSWGPWLTIHVKQE